MTKAPVEQKNFLVKTVSTLLLQLASYILRTDGNPSLLLLKTKRISTYCTASAKQSLRKCEQVHGSAAARWSRTVTIAKKSFVH